MSTYRKLFPSESGALSAHLCRLSPTDRSMRFMGGLSDDAVKNYCEGLDWFRTLVIGFFVDGLLRGSAELNFPDGRYPMLGEVAISVERAWQDHGVATELLRRVLVIARNRGVRGLHIVCYGDNYRMQHVAEKFGARFDCRDGESEADIPMAAPTCASLCEEAIDDGFSWMNIWLEQSAALALRSAASPSWHCAAAVRAAPHLTQAGAA